MRPIPEHRADRPVRNDLAGAGRAHGFTLVELITAMVLTGILAAVAAVFLQLPIQGYFDVSRRAALTDAADLALRRLDRDISLALPNSLRVSGTCSGLTACTLEYLEVKSGGRYRSQPASACGSGSDALDVGVADGCFNTLGPLPDVASITSDDYLVLYNLGQPGADAWAGGAASGGNKSRITAVTAGSGTQREDRVQFQPVAFALTAPDHRFHIVSGPVSYVCDPASRTLTRYWDYPIRAVAAPPPAGARSALLASGVSQCSFVHAPSAVAQRNDLVSARLQLSQSDATGATERVTLFAQIHVSNTP